MDCINITGIRCYGYIGYFPEEQVLGQWFEVDLKLWLDLSIAADSDGLENTIDYSKVIGLVQSLVKSSKFLLLERLASVIADRILQDYSSVQKVFVSLGKMAAPIPDFNGRINIEITKQRS